VRNIVEQLRATGTVRRGIIGVRAQTIAPWLAEGLGLRRDWGVVLSDVYPGGPAAAAGLAIGDIVLTLDGKPMENGRQFDVNVYAKPIGKNVTLEILRGDRQLTKQIQVIERIEPDTRFLNLVTPDRNLLSRIGVLGLDLSEEVRRMLPNLRRTAGVVVAGRAADYQVFGEPLEPGDVIYALNGEAVGNLRELRARLDRSSRSSARERSAT
jgi:serine protease Do